MKCHNFLTHRPSDPDNCDVCRAAKIAQHPARRVGPEAESRATRPLGRVHIDLIGPLQLARDNSKYAMIAKDECSEWMVGTPLQTKNSTEVASAFG